MSKQKPKDMKKYNPALDLELDRMAKETTISSRDYSVGQNFLYSGIITFLINALGAFLFWHISLVQLRFWIFTWVILFIISEARER